MLLKHSLLQYLVLTMILAAPPIPSNTNSFVYNDYINIYLYRLQIQVLKLENNFTYAFTYIHIKMKIITSYFVASDLPTTRDT